MRLIRQSLKDTFADKLPAEIEKIKKLRMYANSNPNYPYPIANHCFHVGTMAARSSAKLPSTRPTVALVA